MFCTFLWTRAAIQGWPLMLNKLTRGAEKIAIKLQGDDQVGLESVRSFDFYMVAWSEICG